MRLARSSASDMADLADLEELPLTFDGAALLGWIRAQRAAPQLDVPVLLAMVELDKLIAPAVCDSSVASHYSPSEEGKFWHAVCDAFPDILEWLAFAPDEDVKTLRSIFGAFIGARLHAPNGARVGFRDLIVKEDRAAVVRFAFICDEAARSKFFNVLSELAKGQTSAAPDKSKGFRPRSPRGYSRFRSMQDRDFVISGTDADDPGLRPSTDDGDDVDDGEDVVVLVDTITLPSPGSHFDVPHQPSNVEMARAASKALDAPEESKATPNRAECYSHFDC
mmetsp:Transcript_1031/g.3243  ORF Transcript_1031/g.3243 Transcript_1031/m.3243 type:complete len:279 (-) Transcript_1031:135-971(-)